MRKEFNQLEQRRVKRLAKEYRDRGYDVVVNPDSGKLPKFFGQYRPDLLVSKKGEHIAVEVRSRESLSSSKELMRVAKEIEQNSNWRLEFVVTNPSERTTENNWVLEPYTAKRRWSEAQKLLRSKMNEAALLLGWSALENVLRTITKIERIPIQNSNPNYLLKLIYSRGLIGKSEFQILDKMSTVRSRIAHGFEAPGLSQKSTSDFLRAVSHVIGSYE